MVSKGDGLSEYRQYLGKRGLKSTRQRDLIVGEFFAKHRHITAEELWERVRETEPKIGYATVYRTLKLLTDCGLALKREFGGGLSRFEQTTSHHHDHMICLGCRQILEFENDRIEGLQERISRSHGFRLVSHKLELYGYCATCLRKGKGG